MYNAQALKYAPWSFSKIGTLENCGRQFVYKYVHKAKETTKKSVEARSGVALHAVLEAGLKTPGLDLHPMLFEQIDANELTRDETIEATSRLPAIEDFIGRWQTYKKLYGVKKELIEFKLGMTSDHTQAAFFPDPQKPELPPVFFRGVLDLGGITEDDVLVVIDHKSGKKKPIGEHSKQFYVYMLMVLANFPEIRGVQSGINYIGEPKIDWFDDPQQQKGMWTRDDIRRRIAPWMYHYINRACTKLPTVTDETGALCLPKAETSWACSYCGYPASCPEGQAEADKRAAKAALKASLNV